MTSQQRERRDDAKLRILRLLHEYPEMSQRDLARAVGISAGRVHYVLTALVKEGLIKFGNFTAAEDKRRYAYILTREGITARANMVHAFLERRIAEYEALKAEIEEVQAELATEKQPT